MVSLYRRARLALASSPHQVPGYARLEEGGVHILKISLCLLLKKYRQTGNVVDRPSARASKKLIFTDNGDELTIRSFNTFGWETSQVLCVSQHRKTSYLEGSLIGYQTSSRTRYCQIICETMQGSDWTHAGRCWAIRRVLLDGWAFGPYSLRCYWKIGEPRKLKPRVKHPAKVHAWGGISLRGALPMVLFTSIMKSMNYSRKSLLQTSDIQIFSYPNSQNNDISL